MTETETHPAEDSGEGAAYVHRPVTTVVQTHLARYPRHYGALAVFLVAMLLAPTVGGPTLAELAASTPQTPAGGDPAAGGVSAGDVGDVGGAGVPPTPPSSLGDLLGVDDETVEQALEAVGGDVPPATGGTEPPPLDDAPPPDGPADAGPVGQLLPPPPALPLGPVPEEVEPIVAAVAPLTATGCSALGLSGVLVAIVGTTAQDVPADEILPYLGPAFSACALFPAPEGVLICDVDRAARDAGYPADVSGLAKTPNLVGTAVEVLYGVEAAIVAYTGQSPGTADAVAELLGCVPDE